MTTDAYALIITVAVIAALSIASGLITRKMEENR